MRYFRRDYRREVEIDLVVKKASEICFIQQHIRFTYMIWFLFPNSILFRELIILILQKIISFTDLVILSQLRINLTLSQFHNRPMWCAEIRACTRVFSFVVRTDRNGSFVFVWLVFPTRERRRFSHRVWFVILFVFCLSGHVAEDMFHWQQGLCVH